MPTVTTRRSKLDIIATLNSIVTRTRSDLPTGMGVTCFILTVCLVFFVQGPSHAGTRFADNGDGTITDHQLGVMWAKTDNLKDIDWNQAHAWIKSGLGTTAGKQYSNWRFPTIEELQSLYVSNPDYDGYRTQCGLIVKIVADIQISCVLIWASDTALGSHVAFNFNIGNPFTVPSYDTAGCRALAVRDLE